VSDLESRLTRLGRELDWPPTPDLSASVRRRVASQPARPALVLRRSLVFALLGLLIVAGGVLAAVPGVRDPVLEFFGLQGATVERRGQLPAAPESRELRLGERTTLAGARAALGSEPLVPQAAGRPDEVYRSGAGISLAYRARAGLPRTRSTRLGLLVSEFRGDLAPEYVGKIAGQATLIERFRVDGDRAIWMEGAPHFFFYRRPDGSYAEETLRVAQNVLLLEQGNLLVRFEGAFGRDRALRLARSLR
jgi:hypothetical protein